MWIDIIAELKRQKTESFLNQNNPFFRKAYYILPLRLALEKLGLAAGRWQ
jgi:hypothetical protein